ncbi:MULTISPECIES: DUF2333 family protein [Halomonadaceae]|uniref:DUF2333 family protein n=1 Tax=Halomonadaceae TaxID=28256 RepID=UPI00159888EA|nr:MULTISPECIES: DUF2333 family protein [Halomonas]QJQ94087.1 DUF2333 family protein [Halomonas sp. PA5]
MSVFGKRKDRRLDTRKEELERPYYGWIWKPLLVLLVLYLLATLALGLWWSRPPAPFDVEQVAAERREQIAEQAQQVALTEQTRGEVTISTMMELVATLLDKPGGYLRNDVFPPGLWLDNMPNWELGVLQQVRDMTQELPLFDASRPGVLNEANERLRVDSRDWLFPSAEHRFGQAIDALGWYLQDLVREDEVAFVAEGEPLVQWLEQVEMRLDRLSQRLSASVGEREALRDLQVDTDNLPARTPWYKIDDIFFEARGTGWALLHLLQAVEHDYVDLIEAGEAGGMVRQMIHELEMTQRRIMSPVILNGSGFGLFANHSLVMANYTVRARDLARELGQRLEGVSVSEPAEAEEAVTPPATDVDEREEQEEQAPIAADAQDAATDVAEDEQ